MLAGPGLYRVDMVDISVIDDITQPPPPPAITLVPVVQNKMSSRARDRDCQIDLLINLAGSVSLIVSEAARGQQISIYNIH